MAILTPVLNQLRIDLQPFEPTANWTVCYLPAYSFAMSRMLASVHGNALPEHFEATRIWRVNQGSLSKSFKMLQTGRFFVVCDMYHIFLRKQHEWSTYCSRVSQQTSWNIQIMGEIGKTYHKRNVWVVSAEKTQINESCGWFIVHVANIIAFRWATGIWWTSNIFP